MMASMAQGRALAGCKAFTAVRPRVASRITNGVKYTMKRRDAYMVEVEVGEDEPEDVAVRRYMKLVMQSGVVEKQRARRTKETKIEEYKRRFRERCEKRKSGFVEPEYLELYGTELDPRAFDDFFSKRDNDDQEEGTYDYLAGPDAFLADLSSGGSYNADQWSSTYGTPAGSYVGGNNANWQGGYMS